MRVPASLSCRVHARAGCDSLPSTKKGVSAMKGTMSFEEGWEDERERNQAVREKRGAWRYMGIWAIPWRREGTT